MTWLERLEEAEARARSMTTQELITTVTSPISSKPKPGYVDMLISRKAGKEIIRRWIEEHKND